MVPEMQTAKLKHRVRWRIAIIAAAVLLVLGVVFVMSRRSSGLPTEVNRALLACTGIRGVPGNLYLLDGEGNIVAQLTDTGRDSGPDWSPDGKHVAFLRKDAGQLLPQHLMVIDLETGQEREVTSAALIMDSSWSPDSATLAFSAAKGRRSTPLDIYIIDVEGQQERQLTDASGDDQAPDWSPDGSRIVFESTRDGPFQIYSMLAEDGRNQTRLTATDTNELFPVWSSGGTEIAFSSSQDGIGGVTYVMDSQGRDQRKLVPDSIGEGEPVLGAILSPTGLSVAFMADENNARTVYIFTRLNNELTVIEGQQAIVDSAGGLISWSPGGDMLLMRNVIDNIWQYQVLNLTTREVRHIADAESILSLNCDWKSAE